MEGEHALLRHAVTPPRFEDGWLHRDRLVDLIEASIPNKLITITAPAGYGKTTLLADFSAHTDLPVAWVRIAEADKDPASLIRCLIASLERLLPDSRGRLGQVGDSVPDYMAVSRLYESVLWEASEKPVVVILDNAHLSDWSGVAGSSIEQWFGNISDNLTFIISRRSPPKIPYARLIGEGRLLSLGHMDLALTKREIADLAAYRNGIDLSDAHCERILRITRGWIMGVVMLLDRGFSDVSEALSEAVPDVHEYLISTMLDRKPRDEAVFVTESAVLPIMTSDACDLLLERSDSEQQLKAIADSGGFISRSEGIPRTFEYHPLFRGAVLNRLERDEPERLKELRTRAAELLEELGSIENAVELYLETGNVARAASLADKQAREMLRVGKDRTLRDWSEKFEKLGVSTPMVHAALAITLVRRGDIRDAAPVVDRARQSVDRRTSKAAKAYVDTAEGIFLYATGMHQEAEDLAARALAEFGKREPQWAKAALLWLRGWNMARGLRQFERAEEFLAEAAACAEDGGNQYTLSLSLNGLATVQIALGKTDDAYRTARKGYELLKTAHATSVAIEAKLLVARVARQRGDFDEALHFLEEALRDAEMMGADERKCDALNERGGILSDLGLHEEAASCLQEVFSLADRIENARERQKALLRLIRDAARQEDHAKVEELLAMEAASNDSKLLAVGFRIESAAARMHSDPSGSRRQLEQILAKERLEVQDELLVRVMIACAALRSEDFEGARNLLEAAITQSSLRGMVAQLGVEVSHCRHGLLDLARDEFGRTPVVVTAVEMGRRWAELADGMRSRTGAATCGPKELSLVALGKMLITLGGKPIEGPKPRALHVLCYLVDHGHENRDVLLERFWPGHPPGKGVANLHADVYSLRRAIGKDAILLEGTTYRMNPEVAITFDVADFEAAAKKATRITRADPRRLELLRNAVEAYKGSFLPGATAEWARVRRERLGTMYLDLLVDHAAEALLQDHPSEALRSIRKALHMNRMREDTNAYLIEALGRLGRKAELSGHYHRYVALLSEDLGIEPAQIVRRAYARWTDDLPRNPDRP